MAHFNELHFRRGPVMAFDARTAALIAALLVNGSAMSAILTVTDTGDAGDGTCDATCTLRDAVDAAQAEDRILFDLALPAPIVIGLTGPALQVDVPLRILANDGVRTTLRRVANAGRLLEVIASGDARIVGLSFENGTAPDAGGASLDGGAVLVASGGALELRACVFRNNSAGPGALAIEMSGTGARGGAIYSAGQIVIDACAFVGNSATGGGGGFSVVTGAGYPGGMASGGAIHSDGVIDITNTTFSGNRAQGGTGGMGAPHLPSAPGGMGGNASGGAVTFATTPGASVAFSSFFANVATGGTGGMSSPGFPMPGFPPLPPVPAPNGVASGAGITAAAATVLNASAVAANTGADQCVGGALLTARTSNLVGDAACPGDLVADLIDHFDPIDVLADSPHYLPRFGGVAVDSAPDCMDAVAVEAIDLDQLLKPRPLAGNGNTSACDFGAIELNPVLFGDGFEEPPPPP